MALYNFKAKTSQGELIEDSMESPNQDVVLSKLRDMNYFVIEVREAKKTAKSINFNISFLNQYKIKGYRCIYPSIFYLNLFRNVFDRIAGGTKTAG
ncbi:MAG: hypothetical protein U5N58_09670 [Actinomycetota bacterium]|nr:hypothetical protein [Actinomycetota bacterium]